MSTTTISGLPDATTPLTGNERVPMDQAGTTKDATTQDIADLAGAAITAAIAAHDDVADPHNGASPTFADLTLTGLLTAPHIHGTLAGDVYVHVKNTSGGALAANTAVYVTGSVGDTDRVEVAACDPTDPAKMPAIGLLKTALANNAEGDAVILGELRPTDTSSYTLGDELYVGAGGALVNTIPASGTVQHVGSVARVQSETGTIAVGIGAGMARVGFTGSYNDLSDTPAAGSGTVTSVGLVAPTGFSVSGSPVTTSGNITLSFAAGYSLPTTASQTNWDTAYSERLYWDGGATGLDAATGRTSLGLGDSATLNVGTTAGTVAAGDDSRFIPAGGTTGQALLKSSGTDYDADWQTLTVSDVFVIACSDETSNLTAGTDKARFTMPYAGTLTAVKADVNTAPTGSTLVVDINEAGVSVLSTKLSIDAGETSSSTAATPAVISDSALANGAVISIDIDQIGSTVAGAGLKVTLYVTRS